MNLRTSSLDLDLSEKLRIRQWLPDEISALNMLLANRELIAAAIASFGGSCRTTFFDSRLQLLANDCLDEVTLEALWMTPLGEVTDLTGTVQREFYVVCVAREDGTIEHWIGKRAGSLSGYDGTEFKLLVKVQDWINYKLPRTTGKNSLLAHWAKRAKLKEKPE